MEARITTDIVLPCYQPHPGWDEKILADFDALANLLKGAELRLILVNDGSRQGVTDEEVHHIRKMLPSALYIFYADNKGKGFALREGVKNSDAEICIYTDVDFPYTPESIRDIWNVLHEGRADIAAGVKSKAYYKQVPFFRKYISRLLRFASRMLLGLKLSDTQCGLKGFNTKGRELFLATTINRYLFDLEFIFLASRRNDIRLQPVEVTLKENVQFSAMPPAVLLRESANFAQIVFRRIFHARS